MVAVWAGSYAHKSWLLASIGKKRRPKKAKKRSGNRHKGRAFFAKQQAKKTARRAEKKQRSNWPLAYQQRNDVLRQIGFVCYANYLVSALWKGIRRRVLERDRYCCYGCRRTAHQVHHRSYDAEVLRGDNIRPLVAICRDCHHEIEHDHSGNKISLPAANDKLEAIRSRHRNRASA